MCTVAIVGLGAIGSAAVPLVARMRGVSGLILIDPDRYDASNLSSQAIDGSAVGEAKAGVQAARVAAINPLVRVHAIEDRVENVPLGRLRDVLLLCCADNRRARQVVNRVAWRCGQPWIDAAVDAPSLVRVRVYRADPAAPCLECAWEENTYALLEQEYPCNAGAGAVPVTAAPAELGALAAALQAAELRKLLRTPGDAQPLIDRQLMLDIRRYEQHLVSYRRTDHCRFDHAIWRIETLDLSPQESTLADLFDIVSAVPEDGLGIEGQVFATFIDCPACGKRSSVGLSLCGRLGDARRSCVCGGRMQAAGFFSFETIRRRELSTQKLSLTLTEIGFLPGDVISVVSPTGRARHFELGGLIDG